ncbi:MAG: 6-phosphofructokinase [Alphaproteobacteria bacterium]|nr:6-phosphofructokinase [Alphaproteobacteria bacterium]
MSRRVGILTGGGDAPGLNAVLRGFVKRAVGQLGWEVFGIEDSFNGLFAERRWVQPLTVRDCKGLLGRGGTVLGTTNRGDPFAFPRHGGVVEDRAAQIPEAMAELGLEGLVCIGGDGTQRIAHRLMTEQGVPVVGVPKTIDNDLAATDTTFGFWSAVDVATDALDRLHTTAESHDRVMFLELMGRDAGHIALHAGIAGGADVILVPEIPYDPARVASKILVRRAKGLTFSIVVVAEGALPKGAPVDEAARHRQLKEGGGAAAIAMASLAPWLPVEMRTCVLGHLQRGGSPSAFDRLLATRFGVGAVDLVAADRWGEMVALRHGEIVGVPLAEAVRVQRFVDPDGPLVAVARSVGTELGA